jgi:hypothetical protein
MDRSQAPVGISAFGVAVGGLFIAVWALFALEMRMFLPAILALGMAGVALLSGAVGVWLHVRHRQLSGLAVSLSAAFFLALLSFTLLATFSVILLALALLLVVGGLIGLTRDGSRRRT